MKKIMLAGVMLFGYALLFAQTDNLNQKKYWKFRNNFRRDFIKIGPDEGESMPIATRRPIACKDNAGGGEPKGTVRWADGMIFQGHYIGFLATEYALLKKRGLDYASTLNELYYALNAINRSDLKAELIISGIDENQLPVVKGENLNGFYLRDDSGEDMWLNWSGQKMDCGCNEGDRYITNNTARLNEGGNISRYETDDHSTPSLDQMTSLLVGITMMDHLIADDVYVQPRPDLPVMNIKNEALQIANRLISYAYDHNWLLLDEWGWPVGNGGGDLSFTAYPIALIGNALTGNDYSSTIKRETPIEYEFARSFWCQPEEDRLEQLLSFDIDEQTDVLRFECGDCNWEYALDGTGISRYEAYNLVDGAEEFPTNITAPFWSTLIPDQMPEFYADWEEDYKFDETLGGILGLIEWKSINWTDYNNNIIFNLGVASGLFDADNAAAWGLATTNYQLVLIQALLSGTPPALGTSTFYQNALNSMPIYGGFKFHGQSWLGYDDDGNDVVGNKQIVWSDGWGGEYKWNDAVESNSSEGHDGQFNALDY